MRAMQEARRAVLAHVARGSEHLRADRLEDASAELKPGDGRIMNLLGLTYFRLGRYPDAQTIYAELVERQPQDASLRLNLGLVHLKRGEVDHAIRELTRARELDPAQVRTMGYLGLAFARKGRYALARDAFHAAGQDELAREMDTQLAAELSQVGRMPTTPPSNGAPLRLPETLPPVAGPPRDEAVIAAASPRAASSPAPTSLPTVPPPSREPAVAKPAAVIELEPPARESSPRPGAAPERLDAFTRRRLVRPEGRDLPLEVSGDTLIVRVRGRILTRAEGVVATGGHVAFAPATRRVRGRVTADPFAGEGGMSFASGDGHLVVLPRGCAFACVQLVDQSLYLREPIVFAFEERLSWENGHVPGSSGTIAILQLRGEGCVALRSRRPILAIEVRAAHELVVDAALLAGWTGSLVPRLTGTTVELAGDGAVYVEEPR
jgi:hypothetical protein